MARIGNAIEAKSIHFSGTNYVFGTKFEQFCFFFGPKNMRVVFPCRSIEIVHAHTHLAHTRIMAFSFLIVS